MNPKTRVTNTQWVVISGAFALFIIAAPSFVLATSHTTDFPSTSSATAQPQVRQATVLCPDGQYVAGIRERWSINDGGQTVTDLYCASGPSGFSFPSTSGAVAQPLVPINGNYLTRCPDGQYMAGINTTWSNNNGGMTYTTLYCAPAPSGFSFPSTSNSIAQSQNPVSGSPDPYLTLCPDGQYMAGIDTRWSNNNGGMEYTTVYCSPAPSITASTPLPGSFGGQCLITSATTAFPSSSNNINRGSGPTSNSWSRDVCPDGEYMSGINRGEWNGGTSQGFQLVCSPAPAGVAFPSSSNYTLRGSMSTGGRDVCPDGEYMSGLDRMENNGGVSQNTQIICSPAPPGYSFPSSSNNINRGSGPTSNSWSRDVCPDGEYMSGINRGEWNGGTSQGFQIVCSPAPDIRSCNSPYSCDLTTNICVGAAPPCGNAGEACCSAAPACGSGLSCVSNTCIATGGTGQQCNPDNTCNTGYCCVAQNQCYPAPAASFTVSGTSFTAPAVVAVDASASGAGTYAWNWGDGSPVATSTSPTATHIFGNATARSITRTITLTYSDTCTRQSAASTSITIGVNPTPPTASFTITPPSGPVPLLVRTDASASADADTLWGGSITRFQWNWGDDTADSFGVRSSHVYDTVGTYTITLTVTDAGGISASTTQAVTVTELYVCTPACSGATPVCGPSETTAGQTQCYQCRSDAQCGAGYQCLGTNCAQGTYCPDGVTACPLDGRCPEAVACAPGSLCADGSACPDTGICAPDKNICSLTADYVPAQCYVETRTPQTGLCQSNADCRDGLNGGVCDIPPPTGTGSGACKYARCLYDRGNQQTCSTDTDCANGDGICSNGTCNYIYDCAYGPGLGNNLPGLYTATSTDAVPAMPRGVQPNGEACTQPTPDAPNNCEGINGCLYYNYNRLTGAPLSGTAQNPVGNSVANCVNEVEGGTGCVYYGDYDGAIGAEDSNRANDKVNCLPRAANRTDRKNHPAYAGLPAGCEVVDRGNGIKDYNCTAVPGDFCYYYADGRVDCDYAVDPDDPAQRGTGCIYEPNPEGTIQCPRQFKAPTAGTSFVQCLLNPDAFLPGFVLGAAGTGLQSCRGDADCPAGNICLNGTCFPQCQGDRDCASGLQCTSTPPPGGQCPPGTTFDAALNMCVDGSCQQGGCPDNLTCNPSTNTCVTCVPPLTLDPLTFTCVDNTCVPGTICPNGLECPQNGICPQTPACQGGFPTGTLPEGTTQTDIGLTTDTNADCRWSLSLTDLFPNMTLFSTTGAMSHLTQVTNLFTIPSYNVYFVRCQESATGTITNACQIAFRVDLSSQWTVCSGATVNGTPVPPALALANGTQSATIGLTTTQNRECRYSAASTDTFAQMNTFSSTGGTTHSTIVGGLNTGNNTQYVRCQDQTTGAENVCRIPFSVGTCNGQYQCQSGYQCVSSGGNGQCVPQCPLGTIWDAAQQACVNTCTPGTTCANGSQCTIQGICGCPFGQWYDAATGQCTSCAIDPTGPGCGPWVGPCQQPNPPPFCNPSPPPPPPICTGSNCPVLSCNTLGYTFTGTAVTPAGNCSLVAIILAILSWLAWLIAVLAVLSGLRAAYLYITSMGDEKRLREARAYLIYTTIGVGVAVLTFGIVAITRAILNI